MGDELFFNLKGEQNQEKNMGVRLQRRDANGGLVLSWKRCVSNTEFYLNQKTEKREREREKADGEKLKLSMSDTGKRGNEQMRGCIPETGEESRRNYVEFHLYFSSRKARRRGGERRNKMGGVLGTVKTARESKGEERVLSNFLEHGGKKTGKGDSWGLGGGWEEERWNDIITFEEYKNRKKMRAVGSLCRKFSGRLKILGTHSYGVLTTKNS